MKLIKLSLAAALVVSLAYAEEKKSEIGVSANVALTSNYVWRGMTQSNDNAAIQGGFDVDYKGVYIGVWGSNISFTGNPDASVELDAYAGYTNNISKLTYDVGYIQYSYPNDSKALNFGEAYLGLSYDFKVVKVNAKYNLGVQTDEINPENEYSAGVSIPLPMDISIDATIGNYENTGLHYIASVRKAFGKFNLSLAYTAMDYETNGVETEDNVVATISASF